MAFTYLILNTVFILYMVGLFWAHIKKPSRAWWITLVILLALTAVFDSIIIWADIVAYDPAKILGIYVGTAPIEDFFYAVLAVMIVPMLWRIFGKKKATRIKHEAEKGSA